MSKADPAAGERKPVRPACLYNPPPAELATQIDGDRFVWIDLERPTEEDLARLAEHVKLHPLTVEDARTFRQRPKIEEYDDYVFMVVFGVAPGTSAGGPLLREVHVVITGQAVITIRHRPFDALDDLRTRLHDQPVRSEQLLVYRILDEITSTFIPVLSRVDDDIDDIEQGIIESASTDDLQRIFSLKRDLVAMRRVVTPMRDMFARSGELIAQLPGLHSDERLYFRDLYDGMIRISELVDSYRDLLSGATDMYLSTVANRQGEINRQLTIIATIFLPLTFLTGFFGQNFGYLVNHVISGTWAFWALGIGLLVVSVACFGVYFRRRGWL